MSSYQFFASDKELSEYDNEVVSLGRRRFLYDKKSDVHQEIEVPLDLRIHREDDVFHARRYTNKRYCAHMEWYYNQKNAETIIAYIKEHLNIAEQIELWNTWLEEKEKKITICWINNLNTKYIEDMFGKDSYTGPECLLVHR